MPRTIRTASDAVEGHDLTGQTFLVTGAYSGLGAATTRALLEADATVVLTGRNPEALRSFATEVTEVTEVSGEVGRVDASRTVDLGSLASVRDFAVHVRSGHPRIDGLILNAGVMNTPYGLTEDGFEVQMGTNVIGHFLLAKLLVEHTRRQVWLSSEAHALVGSPPGNHDRRRAPRIDLDAITEVDEATYDGWARYQQSKLGDVLLAKHFPVEYDHLTACAVHPGIVLTNLARHVSLWSRLKFVFAVLGGGERPVSPEQGARTQTRCAVMPDADLVSGAYYADADVAEEALAARNTDDAKRLYDYCDDVTRRFQG